MIKIDFTLAIFIYFSFVLFLVLMHWLFYNKKKDDEFLFKTNNLHQCQYCTSLFFNYSKTKIITCPRCKSYIMLEELLKTEGDK